MSDRLGYVLLCRHAPHHRGELIRADARNGRPSLYPTESVADRLRELLTVDRPMRLIQSFYAATPEARSTARLLQLGLSDRIVSDRTRKAGVDGKSRIVPPEWYKPEANVADSLDSDPGDLIVWNDLSELNPAASTDQSSALVEQKIGKTLEQAAKNGCPRPAVAAVGHSPQLEQLAARLQSARWWRRRAWLRGGIPIQSGEVVCMVVTIGTDHFKPLRNGRLAWQISPDDSTTEGLILEKIKSKMEAAKQLSAVITLLLTVLLGVFTAKEGVSTLQSMRTPVFGSAFELDGQRGAQIAFVLLVLSLGLFLAAMYAYDSLLMPSRFWPASPARRRPPDITDPVASRWLRNEHNRPHRTWLPRRPPGSTAWVLNRNMQRTWAWLFQPAVVLVIASIVILAVPVLRLGWLGQLLLMGTLLVYVGVVRRLQPSLGTPD